MRKIHVMWAALVAVPLAICSCMPTNNTAVTTCCAGAKHQIRITEAGRQFGLTDRKGSDATVIETNRGSATICWQNDTSWTVLLTFADRHGSPSRVFSRDRVVLRPGKNSCKVTVRGGLSPRRNEDYTISVVPAPSDSDKSGQEPKRRTPTVRVGEDKDDGGG